MCLRLLQAFEQADTWPARSALIKRGIAFFQPIFQPESHGVHLQFPAQFIHCRFQGKGGLRRARRTIGTHANLVGQYFIATNIQVRTTIGTAQEIAPKTNSRTRVSAAIKNDLRLHRDQRTITPRAEFDGDDRLRSRITRQQVLRACIDQAYRFAGSKSRRGGERLNQAEFAAKGSTYRHRLDPYLPLRDVERLRYLRTHGEHALRTGPDGNLLPRSAGNNGDRLRLN